jgi:hypothetical protein
VTLRWLGRPRKGCLIHTNPELNRYTATSVLPVRTSATGSNQCYRFELVSKIE